MIKINKVKMRKVKERKRSRTALREKQRRKGNKRENWIEEMRLP